MRAPLFTALFQVLIEVPLSKWPVSANPWPRRTYPMANVDCTALQLWRLYYITLHCTALHCTDLRIVLWRPKPLLLVTAGKNLVVNGKTLDINFKACKQKSSPYERLTPPKKKFYKKKPSIWLDSPPTGFWRPIHRRITKENFPMIKGEVV